MKVIDFKPELLPTIAKLEVHAKRSVLSTTLTGNWISKIRGHGIEFGGYRQYASGDDASQIDWKASRRARKLLVKEIDEEKNLNVYFFIDVSDTMLFGTTDKIKAELVAELVSSLSFAMLKGGESVGMALFSDKLHRFVPLSQGMGQHATLMKVIANPTFYGGAKDIEHSASQLISTMGTPGLIIVISDFIGMKEADERMLKIIAEQYDLIGLLVRDPRDRTLPASGEYVLKDPTSGQALVIDTADYALPYREYVHKEEQHLTNLFRRAGADLAMLETTDDYARVLTEFFIAHNKRQQQ